MKIAQRVAFTTCAATLILVAIGVWVRASGSGLGCPDWPLCHGGVVPPGDQGHEPLIEFSHRLVASVVGLLVIATAVFAWRSYQHAPLVRWAAYVTVPMVGFQGILGAITVWRELPPEVVATHLLTAMLVLSLQAFVAFGMYAADPSRPAMTRATPAIRKTGTLAIVGLAYFAVLLWIGGYMTESGASTACEGWPLCNGSVLPAADEHEVTHMLHRYLAAGFAILLVPLTVALWRQRAAHRLGVALAAATAVLYTAQVVVGALNVWFTFPEPLTISHTVVASLIWFTMSTAAVTALYLPATASMPAVPRGLTA
jgi:heme A synthase